MRIAIYARHASWVQGATDPIEDQIVACRNRAVILGGSVEPSFIYRDIGVSGISPIRDCPGLKSLLENASLVVVLDFARLVRSYYRVSGVYRALHGSGVRIVSANGEELRGLQTKKTISHLN